LAWIPREDWADQGRQSEKSLVYSAGSLRISSPTARGFAPGTGNLLSRPFWLMAEATSRRGLILRVEDGFVDVGPEFFEDEGARIDADVGAPLCEGVGQGALL
jgi:hypothetical protein